MEELEKVVLALEEQFGELDFDNYKYVANLNNGSYLVWIEEDENGNRGVKVEATDMKFKTATLDFSSAFFGEPSELYQSGVADEETGRRKYEN